MDDLGQCPGSCLHAKHAAMTTTQVAFFYLRDLIGFFLGAFVQDTSWQEWDLSGIDDPVKDIFRAKTDEGSNMIKGYEELKRSPCTIHKIQRSVGKFTKHKAIDPVFAKGRGTVGYFNSSTIGNSDLMKCCKEAGVSTTNLIQDMPVRWGTTHDMCNSMREKMQPMLIYDIKYGGPKAAKSFLANRYTTEEWSINNQSVAALQPPRAVTVLLQADAYPTSNIVLPCIYGVIAATDPRVAVPLPWAPHEMIQPDDLRPEVAAARQAMHEDFKHIWIDELPEQELLFMLTCTLCDPRNIAMVFPLVTDELRSTATAAFIAEYLLNWAPAEDVNENVENAMEPEEIASETSQELAIIQPRNLSSFSDFLASVEHVTTQPATKKSQAEEYLDMIPEPKDTDILVWWGQNEHRFPELARMAAQFLGCPASSASAERIFSLAGRLYDKLTSNMSDGKLEERMFAKLNRGKRDSK